MRLRAIEKRAVRHRGRNALQLVGNFLELWEMHRLPADNKAHNIIALDSHGEDYSVRFLVGPALLDGIHANGTPALAEDNGGTVRFQSSLPSIGDFLHVKLCGVVRS